MAFISIFLASILGSMHCAGMCGGFVTMYSVPAKPTCRPNLAYHFGRLTTYLCLGAIVGVMGSSVDALGRNIGLHDAAPLVIGIGLILGGCFAFTGIDARHLFGRVSQKIVATIAGISRITGKNKLWTLRSFFLGLLSTLLPCGWLYSFLAIAAASGGVPQAMVVMFAFWLGTIPALVSLSTVLSFFGKPMMRFHPRLTAILIIMAGLFSLSQHGVLPNFLTQHTGQTHGACHN